MFVRQKPRFPREIELIARASLARVGTRLFVYQWRGAVYVVREARA